MWRKYATIVPWLKNWMFLRNWWKEQKTGSWRLPRGRQGHGRAAGISGKYWLYCLVFVTTSSHLLQIYRKWGRVAGQETIKQRKHIHMKSPISCGKMCYGRMKPSFHFSVIIRKGMFSANTTRLFTKTSPYLQWSMVVAALYCFSTKPAGSPRKWKKKGQEKPTRTSELNLGWTRGACDGRRCAVNHI